MFVLGLIIGASVIGAPVGFFVAALLCAGARADEASEIAQAHARDRQ